MGGNAGVAKGELGRAAERVPCINGCGLLATRAPHRPNQLSLSALQVTHVDAAAGRIGVLGLDLLDGTPVLDVKPYVPPFDAFPEARYGWIEELSDGDALGADRLDYWPPPAHLDG